MKKKFKDLAWTFFDVGYTFEVKEKPVGDPFRQYLFKNYTDDWALITIIIKRFNSFFSFLNRKFGKVYDVYLDNGGFEVEIERKSWLKIKERNRRKSLSVPGIELKSIDDYLPVFFYKISINRMRK